MFTQVTYFSFYAKFVITEAKSSILFVISEFVADILDVLKELFVMRGKELFEYSFVFASAVVQASQISVLF